MQPEKVSEAFASIYTEAVQLWQAVPEPERVPVGEWTREDQSQAAVTALAWGWIARTVRTGQAAIAIEKQGYAEEAAPLVRSTIEHAIRLAWAAKVGRQAFEVALRAKKFGLERMEKNQSEHWSFTAEQLDLVRQRKGEALSDSTDDTLIHLSNIMKDLPELQPLFQAWIVVTQACHPSVDSAGPYFYPMEDQPGYKLRRDSAGDGNTAGQVSSSLLVALQGYADSTGLTGYFSPRLEELSAKWALLAASLRDS